MSERAEPISYNKIGCISVFLRVAWCRKEAGLSFGGGARIKSATSAFDALRGCFFANKDINLIDKGKVYVAICLSVLLYGSECWRPTEKLYNKLRTVHNKRARAMCRITMHHTIKTTSKVKHSTHDSASRTLTNTTTSDC